VTVAVDGQETRLVFNEYSSFFSPYLAPVTNSTCLVLLDVVAFNFLSADAVSSISRRLPIRLGQLQDSSRDVTRTPVLGMCVYTLGLIARTA